MTIAIDNTGTTSSVASANFSMPAGLDASSIMAYCSSRLNSIDSLIASRFAEQQKRNSALEQAGKALDLLSQWQNGVAKGSDVLASPSLQDGHKNQGAAIATMYNNTTDPDVRNMLAGAYKMATGNQLTPGPDGKVPASQSDAKQIQLNYDGIGKGGGDGMTKEEYNAYVGQLKTTQDSLSKDSELSMIQLNSIISQRQQAVQLAAQLQQSVDKTMDASIEGIGK